MLKNKLIKTISLAILSASISANPCLSKYAKTDKVDLPKPPVKEKSCQLSWKSNNKEQAIETIYMEKACSRFDGGKKVDCIFIRHCPDNPKKDETYGTPIYYQADYFNTICSKNQKIEYYPILGLDDEVPKKDYRASVKCINKKPVGILLEGSNSKSKLCNIPSL